MQITFLVEAIEDVYRDITSLLTVGTLMPYNTLPVVLANFAITLNVNKLKIHNLTMLTSFLIN